MKKSITIISVVIISASCKNQKHEEIKIASPVVVSNPAKPKFTISMVNNKIDLSCGMPLTSGIGDTCHYNGKVYGFCSKECKDEFVKDPAGGIKEK
jgi:YHS domain-containing protein